jgi:hypothetical protein
MGLVEAQRMHRPQVVLLLAALAVTAGPAVTLLLHAHSSPLAGGTRDAPALLRGGLCALVAVGALVDGRRPSGHLAILALLALVGVDGMAVNWNNNLTNQPPAVDDGLPSTVAFLRTLPPPFRIATDGDQIIPADDFGKFDLATDQGYNDFRLAAVDDLITSTNLWRAWQLLDVHEFLTTRTFGSPYNKRRGPSIPTPSPVCCRTSGQSGATGSPQVARRR